jgi:hypothetical protein
LTEILNIDSPFSGDIRLSSIFVMILSLLFSLVCFDDFLTEYEILFYPEGQHDTFAKRYHKMGNILAKSVWGTIKGRGEIRPGTKISILDSGMKVISSTATDTSGYFQFKNEYIAGLGKTRFFLVVDNSSNQRFEIYLGEDIVPYFEIDLDLHDSN